MTYVYAVDVGYFAAVASFMRPQDGSTSGQLFDLFELVHELTKQQQLAHHLHQQIRASNRSSYLVELYVV